MLAFFFRISDAFAGIAPDVVATQYTDCDVSDETREAVARDFREGFRQGPGAAVREGRLFTESTPFVPDATISAWHGIEDGNAPLAGVERLVGGAPNATLGRRRGDHLSTFLEARSDVLEWLAA